jgi:hypothetical protein
VDFTKRNPTLMVVLARSELSMCGAARCVLCCCCLLAQGGFDADTLLTILLQVVAALAHLHRLGILHRDLRASNVLVACLSPLFRLCILLADFGVSHILSAFVEGGTAGGMTSTAAGTLLRGTAALGPLQWCAPEVRAGFGVAGAEVVATKESDVYMFGGLLYELLTGGTAPFHWLAGHPSILHARLQAAGEVEVDGVPVPLTGLLHHSVLEAATVDRKAIPWFHGVLAEKTPEVAAALRDLCARCVYVRAVVGRVRSVCLGWPLSSRSALRGMHGALLCRRWLPGASPGSHLHAPSCPRWATSCGHCWPGTAARRRLRWRR